MDLKDHIRSIPDFPKPGILFYDISTLLRSAEAWKTTVDRLAERIEPYSPDMLVGIESRGFLVAAPVAYALGCGFTMVRKPAKLPGDTVSHSYELEYGSDTLEIQTDGVKPGQKVVVLDDLLAPGGTLAASIALLQQLEADVRAAACVIELDFLDGRSRIDVPVETLITYSS